MAFYRQVNYAFWRAISNFSKALDKAFNAGFLRRHKPGLLVWLRFNGKHGYMKIRGIHNFWIWPPIHVSLHDTITMTYTITDVDAGKEFASFAGTFAFDQEFVRQKLLHTGYGYYDNILTEAVRRPIYPDEEYPIVYLLEDSFE
jgi:hypothetical protein